MDYSQYYSGSGGGGGSSGGGSASSESGASTGIHFGNEGGSGSSPGWLIPAIVGGVFMILSVFVVLKN